MKIVDVRETVVPISSEIRNAYIDFTQMTVSVVAIISDVEIGGRPIAGFGFNSNGRYAPSGLLRERFIPRLLAANACDLVDESRDNFDPNRVWAVLMKNEKPGGHGERSVAVGVLDMAIWDLVAKVARLPLYRLLAERYNAGVSNRRVFVYAAGGYYYPNSDLEALRREIQSHLERGYSMVKMKIGGASLDEDLRRIEAVLKLLSRPDQLAVDANGRFDLETAIEYAKALTAHGLRWFEEPGDPLDYQLQAEVASHYPGSLASGENLFSMQDARNLIRYGGMRRDRDILQFDCALSYGFVEYLRTIEMIEQHGWSRISCIPHGGHQLSLHIAAGLGLGGNESYPDLFKPFTGFADGTEVRNGYITLQDTPGIGFENQQQLFVVMNQLVDA